jgi:radical SAM superfamily enzyme YgiQ (UPF0313 family)
MELNVRKGSDRFVPQGAYRELEARLSRRSHELAEIPAVVLSCFDRSTRMLPFVLYDKFMFPAGARMIAGALYQAGFVRTRAVFQLWNPNFRPSQARFDGKAPELLLLSTMQMHAERAYDAIRDAWTMGENRPLIIVGGPKSPHEPHHFWPLRGRNGQAIGPDAVITGEAYILLDLLNVLMDYRGNGRSMRAAFEHARKEGALESVPGLVYLAPGATLAEPALIDTGLQRLVQHLDEMPHEVTGLGLLEPPHRRAGLQPAPLSDSAVRLRTPIASILLTQGCKFNCPYCPIPTLNQKSWRFRSPESTVHELRSVYERYRIKYYFGTDDNFFNRRPAAEEMLTALAAATTNGYRLGSKIRIATEATQFDTYKNRDLLPVAERAGLYALWFGIEDLTAELVNKGQKPAVTAELFRILHQHKIAPMAMMMFHEGQPYRTKDSLYGLKNQVDFLRRAGAISIQCTVHSPAVGTREYETTLNTGRVLRQLGNRAIPASKLDGNHVLVLGSEPAWRRQLDVLRAYSSFYNLLNFFRAYRNKDTRLWKRRLGYQGAGIMAVVWTAIKIAPYIFRLMVLRASCHKGPPAWDVPILSPKDAFPRMPLNVRAEPVSEGMHARR